MSRPTAEIVESHARLTEMFRLETSPRRRNRLKMLMLLHDNPERSLADVARELECSDRSVLRWWQTYKGEGLDGLLEIRNKGRRSQLEAFDIDEIRTKIASAGMTGLEEIRTWLADEHGLRYSRSGVSYALREILRTRRSVGWLLLDDEIPASSGSDSESLALDNPTAVINLLNSLPMTDDVVEWGAGFRSVLHRLLPDVDRISVNVNRGCDLRRPEQYKPTTRLNRGADGQNDGSIWVDTTRANEPPFVRVLEGFKAKGLPLNQFHEPIVQDYFYSSEAYVGTVFLWRGVDLPAISSESEQRFRGLEPFITFAFSDVVARHHVTQPLSGVFHEAAERMFDDADLTNAERRIVTLALLGHQYKEISDIMSVSLDAVKKHFHTIYKKTETRGQPELFAKYFTARLRSERSQLRPESE